MKETIYADVYFLINFSMDFLALFVTARILRLRQKTIRMCASAAVGGVYATMSLVMFSKAQEIALNIAVPALMCLIAFGAAGILKTAKHTFVLFAVSFLMGGGMTALYYIINSFLESRKIYINGTVDTLYSDIPVWLLAMLALFCALISFVWGRITRSSAEKRQVDVIVRDEKREVHFQGLCDSGNLLYEPFGGLPVIIVGESTIKNIVPDDIFSLCFKGRDNDVSLRAQTKKLRIIPAVTVGGRELLKGYVPDAVIIDGIEKKACIACDKEGRDFGGFEAIVPSCMV